MKNMKIEINKHQPLDEVLKLAKKMGYRKSKLWDECKHESVKMVEFYNDGVIVNYSEYTVYGCLSDHKLITIQELREMT